MDTSGSYQGNKSADGIYKILYDIKSEVLMKTFVQIHRCMYRNTRTHGVIFARMLHTDLSFDLYV